MSEYVACPACGENTTAQIPYEREFENEHRVLFCKKCKAKIHVQRVSYLTAILAEEEA